MLGQVRFTSDELRPTDEPSPAQQSYQQNRIASLTTDPPPAADPGLASRALALDAALTAAGGATLPLRPTETALLRDWLHQLAR